MSSPRPPLGLLLKQVQQALRSDVEQALAGSGLTLPQVAVLSALRQRPGQSSAELARASFMRPQSMAEVLDGLVAAGLVTRRPHPAGGRALQAELTPAGVRSLEAAHAAMAPVEARMLGDLGQSEREQLRGLLERCLASLRAGAALQPD
jgi:DNA-binding MarR family transcriptional regulator